MKARFMAVRRGAYAIRLSDVSQLWALMEDTVGCVISSADCSDGVRRTFGSWEDIASYENFAHKQIIELSLRAHSHESDKFISIEFSQRIGYKVQVTIECPDNELPLVKERVFGILEGMRHRVLSYFIGKDVALGIALVILLYVAARVVGNKVLFGAIVPPDDLSGYTLVNYVLVGVYGILLSVPVGYALHRLRASLVPPIYFAIGQGESRYCDWKTRWRTTLELIGGIGSIIAIAGFIASILT